MVELETVLLEPYIKRKHYSDHKYSIDISLYSSSTGHGFTVSLEVKEPYSRGAFPQRRISLEQHEREGHEGVHLQLRYHLLRNSLNIGKLYIQLDVANEQELLELSEGFIYTLYEI